jgi:hypothetical protein
MWRSPLLAASLLLLVVQGEWRILFCHLGALLFGGKLANIRKSAMAAVCLGWDGGGSRADMRPRQLNNPPGQLLAAPARRESGTALSPVSAWGLPAETFLKAAGSATMAK